MRASDHHELDTEQFVVLRRSVLPQVRVRCGREEKCCKENGHRGRCSLQLKPKEDDMVRLVEQIRNLESELEGTKDERDRLKAESKTLWSKLMLVRFLPRALAPVPVCPACTRAHAPAFCSPLPVSAHDKAVPNVSPSRASWLSHVLNHHKMRCSLERAAASASALFFAGGRDTRECSQAA